MNIFIFFHSLLADYLTAQKRKQTEMHMRHLSKPYSAAGQTSLSGVKGHL